MTSDALDRIAAAPAPSHLGQATAIEQSRAVAEVQAAVVVAQQRPRSIQNALASMRESCKQARLAERAFFRYSRGQGNVTGPTVHLARELARCFGNIQYGIAELRRDDVDGYSEMQAYAWDVQTNTRAAQIFVVPHGRDTREGRKPLTDLRDIYENNANMGARRLRAAIFSILPPWFVEEAEDLCNATLKHGGGLPLPQRIANAAQLFSGLGVSTAQLEAKVGRKVDEWTEHDLAQLVVIGRSLQRGETTIADEFPAEPVTAAEVLAEPTPAPAPAKRKGAKIAEPTLEDPADDDWPPATPPGDAA